MQTLLARVVLGAAAVADAATGRAAVSALFADAAAVGDATRWPPDGVLDGYGAGHLAGAWEARLDARVRDVFAALWRTAELVSSVDAVCAVRPLRSGQRPRPQPLIHTDENPFGPGADTDALHVAQGALSLPATSASSAGTTVVAGSHKHHRRLLTQQFPNAELASAPHVNWYELRDDRARNEARWLLQQPGCRLVDVETQAGDLLLWDSRTFHYGLRWRRRRRRRPWRRGGGHSARDVRVAVQPQRCARQRQWPRQR